MEIIGAIYYLSGLFVLIRLIYSFRDTSRLSDIREWRFRFRYLTGRKPSHKEYRDKKDVELIGAHYALEAFELIWVACGLLSGNSAIFTAIILVYATGKILPHAPFGMLYKISSISFSIARFSLYLLMISNHFFLRGDLLKIFGL